MNKSNAIEAINSGATLHINSKTQAAHICVGANPQDIKKIRITTAEQICGNLTFLAFFNNVATYGK